MAENPHSVDVHVGRRVRQRRKMMGITQEKLGETLGLTFQQVQKYERGTNRISASKLFEMATFLKVPVSYFYEDMIASATNPVVTESGDATFEQEHLTSRESRELLLAYYRLPSDKVRKRVMELMRALTDGTVS